MTQQFLTRHEPGASLAIRLFARHAGLVVAALLCLSFGRAEVPLRERVHVPAIMKRLYEHRALEGCDSQSPVFSILANGSESSADSMIIDFNTTHDDNVNVERTRLSLDMPRECLVAPRPPLELKATSSGWTGTRQLHFRRRGASYVAPLEAPLSVINGRLFQVTLSMNESWVSSCPMSEASASLIFNYPRCHHSSRRRFRRHVKPDRHDSPRRRSGSSPGNGLCRRTKLYVEFRDMGWGEWIVAPTGYWAHQCEGSCAFPMSANMNVTNHAAVKSLMHSMTTAGVRAPCCVPVKLAPQNLLYIDSYDHVVLKTFPEMTVADCGCR
ncbi:hypothetical protein HPB47_011309 [Ixodes persulcatus]|uniref:Uncharacterized protein n=1 Tax=Ixodes persulcatus TaxID=34615 RepID=A0AC60NWS6_IXOPE|nr:hypothetical protein HPB47_011309 [Ixodes persulcatus]